MAGKGSAPRKDPAGVQRERYEDNWDRIFRKKKEGSLTQMSEKKEFHENGINYSPEK